MTWFSWIGRSRRDQQSNDAAVPERSAQALSASAATAFEEGVAAFHAGAHDRARAHLESVIAQHHDHADAQYFLGLLSLHGEDLDAAADHLILATHFRPAFAQAWHALARVARRRGDRDETIRCLELAACAVPAPSNVHQELCAELVALGAERRAAGDLPGSMECFERAMTCDPRNARARTNLGVTLLVDRGEHARGLVLIEEALELASDDPDVLCNYAAALIHCGRLEEAILVSDRVLTADAGIDEARLNRALARLKLGRFREGWSDYEARKRVRSNYVPRPYRFPEWEGESLAGRTILVYGEQGIGDEIMFASCLPDLLPAAGNCVIDCAPRLASLFRRSFPSTTVHGVAQSEASPAWLRDAARIDCQIAAGSLPARFRRDLGEFPARAGGYLRADPARVAHWRARLEALGPGRRIGISWRGGLASTRRTLRSTRLEDWMPVLRQRGCTFVSLQYGDCKAELEALRNAAGLTVHGWPQAVADLDEMAALVSALDLVISVQTAAVHFAGALDVPAWVLVPAVPEWRYVAHDGRMPWYRSVRLFQKSGEGPWQPLVETVARQLARILEGEDPLAASVPPVDGDAMTPAVAIAEIQALVHAGRLAAAGWRARAAQARWPDDARIANAYGDAQDLPGG